MKLSDIGELSLLKTIRKRFAVKSKDVIAGIGDDTAVIKPPRKNLLATTDMMVEGIHFDLRLTTPYQLGFKLVSINVSDIYAMAGKPRYLLLDIAMDKNTDQSFVKRFFDGIHDAMKLYGVSLIGGDISSSRKDMVIAAALIGDVKKHIKRSGAKPGDRIYVTGNLGDSACGLNVLKKIKKTVPIENTPSLTLPPRGGEMGGGDNSQLLIIKSQLSKLGLSWNTVMPLLRRHLMPEARNPKGFAKYATSMIDLSDGLFIDLTRLCDESKTGAKIFMGRIPVSGRMRTASSLIGLDAMKLACSGGEDYELLFTAPPYPPLRGGAGGVKITCIGEITKKNRIVVDAAGRESQLKATGYRHFEIQR
ncbi:MAG: thiamine-phosphate kinase [Thermodesulfovibrionales bacterium]|nr:thiamine-phosphate kinase [Thermodesulfovibrionales bacterium]